jgi:hypothetical protein
MDTKIKKIILNKKLKKHAKLSKILKYLFIDIANINQEKYYILGSYSLRDYRTINDLDINVDYNEFFKLKKLVNKNIGHIEFYGNDDNIQIRWVFNLTDEYNKLINAKEKDFSIEAFQKIETVGFPNNNFCLKKLIKSKALDTDNNGHRYFNLNTLLKWKKTMNRPKDYDDIKLLETIIK